MPLFEYECKKCNHTFETLVFGNEKVECPECGGSKLEKQMSAPGLAQVSAGSSSPCGDLSLPPCGAAGCRRTGKR